MAIYSRNATGVLRSSIRSLATIVSPSSSNRSPALPARLADATEEHEGPLRPHLKLPVNPNHGFYGFFRLKTNENSHSKLGNDGQPEYIAVEASSHLNTSGRSWNTSELRRKSFKDLHTLWYILLRERNVLATQKAERKRLTVHSTLSMDYSDQERKCKKAMTRIKGVITERRNAYIQAARLRRALRRNPELLQPRENINEVRESMLEGEVDITKALGHEENQSKLT